MIDRKVLLEKMQQFGIDWIGSQGFLDEGQVKHVLDIVENESGLTRHAPDRLAAWLAWAMWGVVTLLSILWLVFGGR